MDHGIRAWGWIAAPDAPEANEETLLVVHVRFTPATALNLVMPDCSYYILRQEKREEIHKRLLSGRNQMEVSEFVPEVVFL
ncbi:MAG: hypothetical protein PVSMB2_35820 [Ktedonobacteraceae bacterium]